MRHMNKYKTVFLHLLRLNKITNKTCVHKSHYAEHVLGFCDLVYYKWQRHDQKNLTEKHCLKSHNLTSLFELT